MVPAEDMFNGHPVVRRFPCTRLFKQPMNDSVKITLHHPDFPNNIANVYVHRKCVRKYGTMPYDESIPAYNCLFLDSRYRLYIDEMVNGRPTTKPTETILNAEDVYALAVKTREFDIRQKGTTLPNDGIPRSLLDDEYINKENYPYKPVSTASLTAGDY